MNESKDSMLLAPKISYIPLGKHANNTRPPRAPAWRRLFPAAIVQERSIFRRLSLAMCLTLTAWIMTRIILTSYRAYNASDSLLAADASSLSESGDSEWVMVGGTNNNDEKAKKIPLEAHIMSKCPDAKDCLQKLVVPAMVQISDKVDFQLSYIGRLDPHSDAVSCMHGPGECLGNIILLCAARLYPDPKLSLGFANCMTANYRRIPEREFVEACAMEHSLDFQKINACISDDGGEGIGLLRDSMMRSQENNVTKSCTVRLNGEIRCIRDGGEWKDCPGGSEVDDLTRDVKKLFDEANQ